MDGRGYFKGHINPLEKKSFSINVLENIQILKLQYLECFFTK